MIGSIVGAGLGAVGSIFGGIKASKAMKKVRNNLREQQQDNANWYNRRYNEDATQRADAQRILTKTEESIRNRNRQAAAAQAVMGGTEESVAAAKAANNEAMAEAASQIAVAADARKDNFRVPYDNAEARNALIDIIRGSMTIGDIRNYIANRRIEQARKIASDYHAYEERMNDEFYKEHYHMGYREYEDYEEQLAETAKVALENLHEPEYYGNIADEIIQRQRKEDEFRRNQESLAERESESGSRGDEVLPPSRFVEAGGNQASAEPGAGRSGGNRSEVPDTSGSLPESAPEERDGDTGASGRLGREASRDLQQEETGEIITCELSSEVNEFGKPFIKASDGSIDFGFIEADSELDPLPIRLSLGENRKDERNEDHGYGYLHINAGHREEILQNGFSSVEEFVESVARNYTDIREGAKIGGNQTYLLEVSDEHNNTLFIQLSRDGKYWNINSAGIFKKKYSRRKPKVYSRPAVGDGTTTDTIEVNSGQNNGETAPAGNSSKTSDDKGNPLSADKQAVGDESSDDFAGENRPNGADGLTAAEIEEAAKAADDVKADEERAVAQSYSESIDVSPEDAEKAQDEMDGIRADIERQVEPTHEMTEGERDASAVNSTLDVAEVANIADDGEVSVVFERNRRIEGLEKLPERLRDRAEDFVRKYNSAPIVVVESEADIDALKLDEDVKAELKNRMSAGHIPALYNGFDKRIYIFATADHKKPIRKSLLHENIHAAIDSMGREVQALLEEFEGKISVLPPTEGKFASFYSRIREVYSPQEATEEYFTYVMTDAFRHPELMEVLHRHLDSQTIDFINRIKDKIYGIEEDREQVSSTENRERGTDDASSGRMGYRGSERQGRMGRMGGNDEDGGKDSAATAPVGNRIKDKIYGIEENREALSETDNGHERNVRKIEPVSGAGQGRRTGGDDGGRGKGTAGEVQEGRRGRNTVKHSEEANPDIEDFGEKIAGARKDMLAALSRDFGNLTERALVELPLSKAVKRPDFNKAAENGVMTPEEAAVAEALWQTVYSEKKPAATKRNTTEIKKWADSTYRKIKRLQEFVEADEQKRAEIAASLREITPADEKAERESFEKIKFLNSGRVFEEPVFTPDPAPVALEVMRRMGVAPDERVTIPFRITVSRTKQYYEVVAANGDRLMMPSTRDLQEALEWITVAARMARGDMDVVYPGECFRVYGQNPIMEPSGIFEVGWLGGRHGFDYKSKTFTNKEEAEKYAAALKEKGTDCRVYEKQKQTGGYEAYRIKFVDPISRKSRELPTSYETREDARLAIAEKTDTLSGKVNELVAKEKGGKKQHKEHYYVTSVYKRDSVVYAVCRNNVGQRDWVYSPIVKEFGSRDEAQAWFKENKDKLESGYEDYLKKRREFVYFDQKSQPRQGKDYRQGADVTPEMFSEAFGFRGVQFGNWTNGSDRQAALNEAYDAFMDLAEVTGLSPRALSLNGELGLAFGARGSGSANAHYESDEVVINLTKTRGAGSLAHEWWHALDNYFMRKEGVAHGFASTMTSENMRPELSSAFKELTEAINKSEFGRRSDLKGEYWGRMAEKTARLFGEWVVLKQQRQSVRNHFLSRGIDESTIDMYRNLAYFYHVSQCRDKEIEPMNREEFAKSKEALMDFPYPTPEELSALDGYMQAVFDALHQETTDGGIILSDRSEAYVRRRTAKSAVSASTGSLFDFDFQQEKESDSEADLLNTRIDEFVRQTADFLAVPEELLTEEMVDDMLRERQHMKADAERYYASHGSTGEEAKERAKELVAKLQAQVSVATSRKTGAERLTQAAAPQSEVSHTTAGGEVIRFEGSTGLLPKLSEGEFSLVERRFVINGGFDFSGRTTIESADDVAYIFRSLESYGTEQGFGVLVKDGRPMVIHLGSGSASSSLVDLSPLRVANDMLGGAEQVYLVHNHPSGNLKASPQDVNLQKRLEMMFPGKVQDAIIMDTTRGLYGTFNSESRMEEKKRVETDGTVSQLPVHTFSAQVFAKDFDFENLATIKSSQDVAQLVAGQRLSAGDKSGVLLLNNANKVVGNILCSQSLGSEQLPRQIADYALAGGATRVAFYGRQDNGSLPLKQLGTKINQLSGGMVTVLDVISVRNHGYESAYDYGLLEPQVEYGESEVREPMSSGGIDFEAMRDRAVQGRGVVMTGLNEKSVRVVEVPRHDFTGTGKEALQKAEAWAKKNITGKHTATDSNGAEFEYSISNDAVEKYLSRSATGKSENVGAHLAALKNLPEIISESIEAEVHPDYVKQNGERKAENGINPESLVHRFYGAVNIDGNSYRVKTTIREYLDKKRLPLAHSYEITQIELLEVPSDGVVSNSGEPLAMTSSNSISVAKLLNGVEKSYDSGKKLLEESEKSVSDVADKQKIQAIIDKQRTILADVGYLDLDDVTKVVKSFENPTVEEEESSGEVELDKESHAVGDVNIRYRFSQERQEGLAALENKRMAERIQELAERLNLDNVEIVTDASQLEGKRAKAKGFFNKRTGKITIVIPNHHGEIDVEQTLLHEAVAHYGLRKLFGEGFNTFLDNVFQSADVELRRKIAALAAKNGWDFRTATDEYLASLAEDTNFEGMREHAGWWTKIKNLFLDMLRKAGFKGFRDKTGIVLSDNELRYILWRSYQNLAEPGRLRNIFSVAEDIAKQFKMKVGNYSENGIEAEYAAESSDTTAISENFDKELDQYESGTLPRGHRFELGMPSSYLRSAGFPSLPISMRSSLLTRKAGDEKHPFEASDLKGLVKAIQKPIAIFEYTKSNMRNLIVDITHGDKHFLVGVTLNYKAGDIEINSISGLFPKENHEWVKWVQDGKAIRIDKKDKVQAIIDSLRTNPAESERIGLNLDDVAKIVESFENPTIEEEELFRPGDFSPRDKVLARDVYNGICSTGGFQFREALQDSMLLDKLQNFSLSYGQQSVSEAISGMVSR